MVLKQQSEQESAPTTAFHALNPEQWQFAALVQHSADLVAITSLQSQIQFINAAGLRLLGLDSLEAALQSTPASFLLPNEAPQLTERILPTVRHGGAWVGELTIRNIRTGEVFPVLANTFLLNEPAAGQPVGYAYVMRDLRERKREEQRHRLLAQVGAELGSTLDYATMLHSLTHTAVRDFAQWCAILLLDNGGRLREVALAHSQQAQQNDLRAGLLDWPFDRTPLWQGKPPDTHTLFLPDLAIAGLTNSSWERLRVLGGPSLISTPLKLRNQFMGALVVASPLGRYYTAEDRILIEEIGSRAAMALEHAQLYHHTQTAVRVRDQFISIASHELRTPLTSMLGNLQLFQRRTQRTNMLHEREQQTLQTVIAQTLRLNRLIGGLLDISRLQQDRLTIDMQTVDLCALAQQVVEELQPTLAHHTLSFQAAERALAVEGDQLRLEQVIQNLLQNAVKYSPAGGMIELNLSQAGDRAIIKVSDQGIGIPRESLPHLFDRFYRAPNAEAQKMSGMGIGLFVAREIVALHGGTIDANSTSGAGSTFTVSLPIKR